MTQEYLVLKGARENNLQNISLNIRLSTLSGGEVQRLKLASELHKKGSI